MGATAWPDAQIGIWDNWVCGEWGNLLRSFVLNHRVFTQSEGTQQWSHHPLFGLVSSSHLGESLLDFFFRSREAQAERARRKSEEIQELRRVNQQLQQDLANAKEDIAEQNFQMAQLKIENQQLRKQPPVLPHDPALPKHEFGPKMISVCVNLAMKVGLRASINCMEIVMNWLDVKVRLPVWTTVRTWLMRIGVAALEEPVEEADDWIWMVDHSNQIGQEKALAIIGMRAANMPPTDVAIRHEDVRLLLLEPAVNWKTDDVAAAYQRLSVKAGPPLAVITDGACELRDSVETLQIERKSTILLSDLKHFAANVLKKVVGTDERFTEFTSQTGSTRSAIQQTELAHFTPVSPKPKARFMNLSATLKWANMVLWHLAHPHSVARQEIETARMNDKLGWLRKYREDIARWSRCQDVVSTAVTFVNEQGLFRGSADQLAEIFTSLKMCEASRTVADRLLQFLREHELKLIDAQRLPPRKEMLSTEILESCFGLFKQLEHQHSKGGFTSLLASFGALLQPATAESVRTAFRQVSVKQTRAWVSNNLGTTVPSKRQTAYTESKTTA